MVHDRYRSRLAGTSIRVASLASRHGFGFSERAVLFLSWCAHDRMHCMKRVLGCLALGVATLAASAQWSNPTDDVPAYSRAALLKTAPPLLAGDQLTGPYFSHSYQTTAYVMAGKIPGVLNQQPCYCRCDRALGHKSLHSCFEGTHGAAGSTCMKEAVFAYQQTKAGKTPAQIRTAIEHGEWESVDLLNASL